MVNVNINAQLFISRYYLAKFQKRWQDHHKRSAVINVSSISALSATGSTTVYASTKAFNRLFSHGMAKEYSEFLDVLTVLPSSTKTNMNSGRYIGTITAAQHGKSVINQLGWGWNHHAETYGHWYHGLHANLNVFWPTAKIISSINYRRKMEFIRQEEAKKAQQQVAQHT